MRQELVVGTPLPPRLVDVRPMRETPSDYGLAVDVGTTSVVGYLVDLLFAEETVPWTVHPDAWHRELDDFKESHKGGQ